MKNKMKLSDWNFQRNGVMGEGFYSVFCKDLTDMKGNFLITFRPHQDGVGIDIKSVRVVNLDKPQGCYRGDNVGYDLQKMLVKLLKPGQTIYDLTEKGKSIS